MKKFCDELPAGKPARVIFPPKKRQGKKIWDTQFQKNMRLADSREIYLSKLKTNIETNS